MITSKVRADYEQLAEIAQVFGQQAESAQKVLSALQDNMNTLQGGDWVGKGSDAFYDEMNSAGLPAMGQLLQSGPWHSWGGSQHTSRWALQQVLGSYG